MHDYFHGKRPVKGAVEDIKLPVPPEVDLSHSAPRHHLGSWYLSCAPCTSSLNTDFSSYKFLFIQSSIHTVSPYLQSDMSSQSNSTESRQSDRSSGSTLVEKISWYVTSCAMCWPFLASPSADVVPRNGSTQVATPSENDAVSQSSHNSLGRGGYGREVAPSDKHGVFTECSTHSLTAEALEAQNTASARDRWGKEEEKRIDRLEAAAHTLGFDLPRPCFQNPKHSWLEPQPAPRKPGTKIPGSRDR